MPSLTKSAQCSLCSSITLGETNMRREAFHPDANAVVTQTGVGVSGILFPKRGPSTVDY
jgi:hypothetical protein